MSFRKFMKWLFILAPIIYIWALISGEESFASWLPAELLAIIISLTILYFCYGKQATCPSCKRILALKKTKEEVVGKEDITVLTETKMKDNHRNVVGTNEQYVPGIKTTYREYYTCKYCGKTYTKDYVKKTVKM